LCSLNALERAEQAYNARLRAIATVSAPEPIGASSAASMKKIYHTTTSHSTSRASGGVAVASHNSSPSAGRRRTTTSGGGTSPSVIPTTTTSSSSRVTRQSTHSTLDTPVAGSSTASGRNGTASSVANTNGRGSRLRLPPPPTSQGYHSSTTSSNSLAHHMQHNGSTVQRFSTTGFIGSTRRRTHSEIMEDGDSDEDRSSGEMEE